MKRVTLAALLLFVTFSSVTGLFSRNKDCFWDPSRPYSNSFGCTSECPCGEGEGDCDGDDDCAGALVCGTNNCAAADSTGEIKDCCQPCQHDDGHQHSNDFGCSSECPCDVGEGDCDDDYDCLGDLICPDGTNEDNNCAFPDENGNYKDCCMPANCTKNANAPYSDAYGCSVGCPCGLDEGSCQEGTCGRGFVCTAGTPLAGNCPAADVNDGTFKDCCTWQGAEGTGTEPPSGVVYSQPDESKTIHRVHVASCYSRSSDSETTFQHMESRSAGLMLEIGDNVYLDELHPTTQWREWIEKKAESPAYRSLIASGVPVMATYDDHDFCTNDVGGRHPNCIGFRKESQRNLLANYNVPLSDERWHQDGVYHARMFGSGHERLHSIVLDHRYDRSNLYTYNSGGCDAKPQHLNATQWEWLENELNRDSEVKIIASGSQVLPPLAPESRRSKSSYCAYDGEGGTFDQAISSLEEDGLVGTTKEAWSTIPQERERLLRLIQRSINNGHAKMIVLVSGDQHWLEYAHMTIPESEEHGEAQEVWELTASGIGHTRLAGSSPLYNDHRMFSRRADTRDDGIFVNDCVFPFTYSGVTYHGCTMVEENKPWCATAVDESGNYMSGEWGACDSLINNSEDKYGEIDVDYQAQTVTLRAMTATRTGHEIANEVVLTWGQNEFDLEDTDEMLDNPERGPYALCPLGEDTGNDYAGLRSEEHVTLCYAPILLSDFRTSSISQTFLDRVSTNLDHIRAGGVKAIVRVLYDDTSAGVDASLEMIALHLGQLRPVLEAHTDVIAFYQAGVIGAWGEWHSSATGLDSEANRTAVWNLLVEYLPEGDDCLMIQIRRPDFAVELEPELMDIDWDRRRESCEGLDRIAHHNDCWLASDSDLGTYRIPGQTSSVAREMMLTFLENNTRTRVWGGETCGVSSRSTCQSALSEAGRLRATYLNQDYHPDVLEGFVQGGCWYDFQRRLGYRFTAVRSVMPQHVVADRCFHFSVTLRNDGWAPLYSKRPAVVRMITPGRSIFIDGNEDDWLDEDVVVEDAEGDTTDAVSDFAALSITSDDKCLYLRIQSHSINASSFFEASENHIFIDTMPNNVGNSGAELMIESGKGYDQRNGGFNEGAVVGPPVHWEAIADDDIEACVPRDWTYQDGSLVFPQTATTVGGPVIGVRLQSAREVDRTPTEFLPDSGFITHQWNNLPDTIVHAEYPVDMDLRDIDAGEEADLRVRGVAPSSLAVGSSVWFALWLPDGSQSIQNDPNYAIRLANSDESVLWDVTPTGAGSNVLMYKRLVVTGPAMDCPVCECGHGTVVDVPCSHDSDAVCVCDAGHENFINNTCSPCLPGHYKMEPGLDDCSECIVGTFTTQWGAKHCQPCWQCGYGTVETESCRADHDRECSCADGFGAHTNAMGTTCERCHRGQRSVQGVCEDCPPGTYQPESGESSCVPCEGDHVIASGAAGSNSAAAACRCADGFTGMPPNCTAVCEIDPEPSSCSGEDGVSCVCQAGYEGEAPTCTECDPGFFKSANDDSPCQNCSHCGHGTVQTSECTQYRDTECACNAGHHRLVHNTCVECPAGTHKNSVGNHDCAQCPQGSYSPTGGQIDCYPCTTCTEVGQQERESCSPTHDAVCECSSGYGQSMSNFKAFKVVDNVCEECQAGHHSRDGMCMPCPHGSYQPNPGQDTCIECSGDNVRPRGGSGHTSIADACECDEGYFGTPPNCQACTECDGEGQQQYSECTATQDATCGCSPGYGESMEYNYNMSKTAAGELVCEECHAGHRSIQGMCVPCYPGSYQPNPGQDYCIQCSGDNVRSTGASGQTSAADACECEEGHFGTPPNCQACSTCSGVGQVERENCTSTQDTVCECSPGYGQSTGTVFKTPTSGGLVCEECEEGHRSVEGVCIHCYEGSYQPNRGQDHCIECSGDNVRPSEGSGHTSMADACECDEGYFGTAPNCEACTVCSEEDGQQESQSCTATEDAVCECSPGYGQPMNYNNETKTTAGELVCEECQAGHRSIQGVCIPCYVGSYQPNPGQDHCIQCSGDHVQPTGETGQTSAADACECEDGYFGTPPNCEECSTCTEYGQQERQACSSTQDTICECSPGYGQSIGDVFKDSNSLVCEECQAGHRSSQGVCVECSAGTYQPNPRRTTCIECSGDDMQGNGETGRTSAADACECAEGYYGTPPNCEACTVCSEYDGQEETQACTATSDAVCECSSGYGQSTTTAKVAGMLFCEECQAGHRSEEGLCVECSVGKYQPDSGQDTCIECSGDHVQPNGETGQTSAADACECEEGHFGTPPNCQACTVCGTGAVEVTECDSNADTVCECDIGYYPFNNECTQCNRGTYKGETGNHQCQPCGTNTYASTTGSDQCEDCTTCTEVGQQEDNECTATSDRTCKCASGYGYASNGKIIENMCEECTEGHYSADGQCTPCPAGSYQPNSGQDTCIECSGDNVQGTGATGQTSASGACECADGYVGTPPNCVEDQPLECDAGQYPSQGQCVPCAAGTYQPNAGETSCIECSGDNVQGNGATGQTSMADACECADGYVGTPPNCEEETSNIEWEHLSGNGPCLVDRTSIYGSAGSDYILHQDQTLDECKLKCMDLPGCVAIEHRDSGSHAFRCELWTTQPDFEGTSGDAQCLVRPACGAAGSRCACEAGFENVEGSSCTACEAGSFKPSVGRDVCEACTTCETGFAESQECTTTQDRTCECVSNCGGECPTGQYLHETSGCSDCNVCGPGTVEVSACTSEANTQCACSDGYGDMANDAHVLFCNQCPPGSYGDADECHDCGAGTYQSEWGATSCDECSGTGVVGNGETGQSSEANACQCDTGFTGSPPSCTPEEGGDVWTSFGNGPCLMDRSNPYGSVNADYILHSDQSLEECQTKCLELAECVAIEHRDSGSHAFRCELWTTQPDRESTSGGAQCLLRPAVQCNADEGVACSCDAGFENVAGTECTECGAGSFKDTAGTHTCEACTVCEGDLVEDDACTTTQDRTCTCTTAGCAQVTWSSIGDGACVKQDGTWGSSGTDYILASAVSSLEECQQACAATEECLAIEYRGEGFGGNSHRCELWSLVPPRFSATNGMFCMARN